MIWRVPVGRNAIKVDFVTNVGESFIDLVGVLGLPKVSPMISQPLW